MRPDIVVGGDLALSAAGPGTSSTSYIETSVIDVGHDLTISGFASFGSDNRLTVGNKLEVSGDLVINDRPLFEVQVNL